MAGQGGINRRLRRIAPPDVAGDQREFEENAEQKQHQPGELESKIMGVGGHKQANDAHDSTGTPGWDCGRRQHRRATLHLPWPSLERIESHCRTTERQIRRVWDKNQNLIRLLDESL